ncbi:MAG: hypothetical protein JRI52_05185, partial [Deltaproteobacteria bacterium]|nr:hypothetical protein [Deltaproteobacteria bacterium]
MTKKIGVVCLFFLLTYLLGLNISYADNAEVLPKGISRAGVLGKFYFPVDERYDPDGKEEDIAEDYNSTLDSSVFPDLELVESAFGMPPGSANIGDSVVSYEYDFTLIDFTYVYGITDKFTLGIKIPYWNVKNDVDAGL